MRKMKEVTEAEYLEKALGRIFNSSQALLTC